MPNLWIYLDNQFIPADDRLLEVLSPGNLPGRGVFETMRAMEGKVLFFERHLHRMNKGLKELGLRTLKNKSGIKKLILQLLKKNKLKNAQVRLSVWEAHGFRRTSIIARVYSPPALKIYRKGFSVGIFPEKMIRKNRANIKSIQYGFYREALSWARSKGFDEALLLNNKNQLAEGSRTNLFFVKNEMLFTPELSSGCLNGIIRQIVLELARQLDVPVKESSVTKNDLLKADEAFLTNSLIGIMPLTKVGRQAIKGGCVGEITKIVLTSYRKL